MSTPPGPPRTHSYHAEAIALHGDLQTPVLQKIHPQLYASLPIEGGYSSQDSHGYRLEGAISFLSAHTQVAGNVESKPEGGWHTLVTSVVEGLNVLDVVTADRVVAQISTNHPQIGYVPKINFLGTRFENLRITGHPVKLHLDLDFLGPKPAGDAPYTRAQAFMQSVATQRSQILAASNLPAAISNRYSQAPSSSADLPSLECSLVTHTEGGYPGQSFGHVIDVPGFGKIYLAVLRLEQGGFNKGIPKTMLVNLTMIELEMGCVGSGSATFCQSKINGRNDP